MNNIKLLLVMNALRKIKLNAVSGGKGLFALKGLSFNAREHDHILRKEGDRVMESIHHSGIDGVIGSIELEWDFPKGWGKVENGVFEFGSEEAAKISLVLKDIKVAGRYEVFQLEELSLEGINQVQEFFLSLPLDELAQLI